MDRLISRCKHSRVKLFTREGAEHTGLDLFARCQDCGFEGINFPHIECNPIEITPKMRRDVLDAFYADARSCPKCGTSGTCDLCRELKTY